MRYVVLCVALAACRSPEESPAETTPTATATAAPTVTASASAAPSAAVTAAGPPPCPGPTILVDDAPMKVASALAVQIGGAKGPYQLTLSTRAIACSELLTGAVAVKRDEISFNVGYGKEEVQRRVDFRNRSAKPPIEMVTAPSKPGDEIAVCVRDRVHLSGKLPMSDDPAKTVDVQGLVGAKFCGALK